MSPLTPIGQRAYRAAHHGTYDDAREVFDEYVHQLQWTYETRRARWDGAASLLAWWHYLEPVKRPPLTTLKTGDAQAFVRSLEARELARSTVKSYRTGARTLVCAIAWALEQPTAHDPFQFAQPKPIGRRPHRIHEEKLEALTDTRARTKLRVLYTLMELGMTLPEVCTLYWSDVDVNTRIVIGYRNRVLTLNALTVEALSDLWQGLPRTLKSKNRRILCWQPDTARRWLKQVQPDSNLVLNNAAGS